MDLNPFRICSGLKFLGYFMIVLVLAILAVSYYAVVLLTWGPHLLHGGSRTFFSFLIILVFHILLVLLTWSYLMVVFHDPGSVPENWKSEENIEEGNSINNNIQTTASVSYCSRCKNCKPPRCHHCSICQRCVLKMDHHCIWVVNCVGARNYKFFLLFVLYTFLETTMDTLVLLPSFVNFFRQPKHHLLSPGNLAAIFLAFDLLR